MDLVRYELLPPILLRDMHREARRRSLAAQAVAPRQRRTPVLQARLGAALIATGCRIQAAGTRSPLASASPFPAPAPCGCGA